MANKVAMTAKSSFTNTRIEGPRTNGAVLPGESFKTDWLHAKELVAGGLAEAVDAKVLDTEPTDLVEPGSHMSVTEHAAINARRAKAAPPAPAAPVATK